MPMLRTRQCIFKVPLELSCNLLNIHLKSCQAPKLLVQNSIQTFLCFNNGFCDRSKQNCHTHMTMFMLLYLYTNLWEQPINTPPCCSSVEGRLKVESTLGENYPHSISIFKLPVAYGAPVMAIWPQNKTCPIIVKTKISNCSLSIVFIKILFLICNHHRIKNIVVNWYSAKIGRAHV